MKQYVAWPDSLSGWCFWASFVGLIGVITAILLGSMVGLTRNEGAVHVLWRVVQFGFASVVAAFLLGVGCSLLRDIRGKGRWRL